LNRTFIEGAADNAKMRGTTINNNNIVININKNYNAVNKLKQVNEELMEDPEDHQNETIVHNST